jgi:hypothetical protein
MLKINIIKLFLIGISIIFMMFISGCAGIARSSHVSNDKSTRHNDSAKVYIYPGETKQLDIIEMFGKPDSVMYKQDVEIWTYEKTADVVRNSDLYLTVYFNGAETSDINSSGKPVKLIMYFDSNGVVKDYSVQLSNLQ